MKSKWLSVKDTSPKVGEYVLLQYDDANISKAYLGADGKWYTEECQEDWGYDGENEDSFQRPIDIYNPQYWQPLPKLKPI